MEITYRILCAVIHSAIELSAVQGTAGGEGSAVEAHRQGMDITYGILCAVIGGLLVLGLTWLWRNIGPRVIQPFLHQEPSIGGEWNTTFEEGSEQFHEVVTVSQRGRNVSGQIVLKLTKTKDDVYTFEGTFRYLILTCTYQSTDPAEYEQGVFALRYAKGKFTGQHVLVSKQSEDLVSSNYEWTR